MRKLALITALWVAALAGVYAAGWRSEAHAATTTAGAGTTTAGAGTIIDYATSYTSPSNTSIPVHNLKPGEQVQTYCFREGQVLNGNPYWFVIRTGGQTAYVHRSSISPPQDVRHC